jgi:tetratricopeptide (TPR) repeat protein
MRECMRRLKVLTSLVLLATMPTMLVYPTRPTVQIHKVNGEEKVTERDYVLSYDDMLRLFDEIESGELEKKCSPEELEKIKHFIAFLAKEGVLPDNSEESLSLDDDIEDLLNGEDHIYEDVVSFVTPGEYRYMIVPAVLYGSGEVVLCKSWVKKQWHHVKKFVHKHKKALIIGAVVVVAAAVVVVAIAAASSAAAGAAGAAARSPDSDHGADEEDLQESPPPPPASMDIPPGVEAAHEAPILKSAIDDQISSFKENVVHNQFFQPVNLEGQQGLSWQENGRALGSLFAHDSYHQLENQLPCHLGLAQEAQEINAKYHFPIPGWDQGTAIGHPEIDRKFSTDYGYLYANPAQEVDFNTFSHQVRGERALSLGYYGQAVQDLGRAIETNPTNPLPYLERGIAHFSLGQYDRSLEDYKEFTAQTQKPNPPSVSEFSLGVAKGLPKGIYESGKGFFLFMADFVKHPIQTSEQIVDSVSTLVDLVRKDEWGVVAEVLSPEVHRLVTQWDTLSPEQRGELAGYAVGKHGADIFVPGALARVAAKSARSAQELAAVYKNLQIAQETLVLETAAEIGSGAKIAEVVEAGQKTAYLANELGVSVREVGQLKQAGKLKTTLANKYEHLSPAMQESMVLHKKAKASLEPYIKKSLPEFKVRELIHETGFPTFPRPNGIPENFLVMVSDKGAGMEYVHPTNTHIRIRVMPCKLHSPNLNQQKPYVVQTERGKALDKYGNLVQQDASEAHILLEEFIYRE